MKKTILLSIFTLSAFLTFADWGKPVLHDGTDMKRRLIWKNPNLENGFIEYDYYTGLAVLRHLSDESTVIKWTFPDYSLDGVFTNTTGIAPRGFIIAEGVTRIEAASWLLYNSFDFVYVSQTVSYASGLVATQAYSRIKWLIIDGRGDIALGGAGHFNPPHFTVDNMISNRLDITQAAAHPLSGFYNCVENLYITDRAKSVLACNQNSYSAPQNILNLQDIPYGQFIEDIKHKPASGVYAHLANHGAENKYSAELGITPKNASHVFHEQLGTVLEFDPYSHTLYYHRHTEQEKTLFDQVMFVQNLDKSYDIKNVIFLDGVTGFRTAFDLAYRHDCDLSVVYTPKTFVYLDYFQTSPLKVATYIVGNGRMITYALEPVGKLIITDNQFTGGFKCGSDCEIYAKSNLIHANVQYTLDAFNYLDFIMAFNTVGNVNPEDIYFETSKQNKPAAFNYTYNVNLKTVTEPALSYSEVLKTGSYDVSLTYETVKAPAGLTATMNHNVLTLTQTGRITPGNVEVKVTFPNKASVTKTLPITVNETGTGYIEKLGIEVETAQGRYDITDKLVRYEPGMEYYMYPVCKPAELQLSEAIWSMESEPAVEGTSDTFRFYYRAPQYRVDKQIWVRSGDAVATTRIGSIVINDTVKTEIRDTTHIFDTIRHVTEEEITVYYYDYGGKTYTVTDDLHHLRLTEIFDTVRTAKYETVTVTDTVWTTEYDTIRQTVYNSEYRVNFIDVNIETNIKPAYETESYLVHVDANFYNLFSPYSEERIYFYDFRGQLLEVIDTGGRKYVQCTVSHPNFVLAISDKGWYQKLLK